MATAYDIDELIKACAQKNQVAVLNNAEKCARDDFGLNTKIAVLDFIASGGLETPHYINTKLWENNPDPATSIMVDAYSFYSGPKQGYIAFFFNPKTNKWLIKSFKLNKDFMPRNNNWFETLSNIKPLIKTPEDK
ncbi:MAG: hypothetical protein ACR65O_09730 [Methylomicrobium sp.]|jgi:hypothetical protein